MSAGKKVAIGAGVVAASVATAGAYYLLGPDAKEHQKKAMDLMVKMNKEIARGMKKGQNTTMSTYHRVVDSISENYAKQYKVHEKGIKAFAQKLKKEWKADK